MSQVKKAVAPEPTPYTHAELLDILKARQSGLTQRQYAREIDISEQMLADIYSGRRYLNDRVLTYLAPTGFHYEEQRIFILRPGHRF